MVGMKIVMRKIGGGDARRLADKCALRPLSCGGNVISIERPRKPKRAPQSSAYIGERQKSQSYKDHLPVGIIAPRLLA